MIKVLHNVLTAPQLRALEQLLQLGQFEDGEQTAGWNAKNVKQNRQWNARAELTEELDCALSKALIEHPEFAALTYPKYIAPFLVSLSENGGNYGPHVDDALMGAQQISRTDISCTVFLSEPDSYEGGELCFDFQGMTIEKKLKAGDAIIYPSTTLHQVKPVTQGVRMVAVSWIESYIRDAADREMLFDLDCAKREVFQAQGHCDALQRLAKTHANLLRRWAQT